MRFSIPCRFLVKFFRDPKFERQSGRLFDPKNSHPKSAHTFLYRGVVFDPRLGTKFHDVTRDVDFPGFVFCGNSIGGPVARGSGVST